MFSSLTRSAQQDTGKYDRVHFVARTPAVALADMIKNPPEGSVKTTITPKLAAEMLAYNADNRPLSAGTVAQYADQMRARKWHYTKVPIIFSGVRLIDGQHRLAACIAADVSITADVAFGAPDDAFAFIDNGRRRTAADVFNINGVTDQNKVAAITSFVANYVNGRINVTGGSGGAKLTNAELFDFYAANRDIDEGLKVYNRFVNKRWTNPSVTAGLYVICARKCQRDAEAFFGLLEDGFGAEKKTEPALVLRNKLIDAATSGRKEDRRQVAGLTISAWNRMRDGLSGRGLDFNANMKMPRVR